jgi:bla regulator protein blaR1
MSSLQAFSSFLAQSAPAAANHIWQSTLFAAVAALLTLTLRKNQARVRYWLWLAASLKFLIPFSLLLQLGSAVAGSRSAAASPAGFTLAEEISQPFIPASTASVTAATHISAFSELGRFMPPLLLALWLGGCAALLVVWVARWRRLAAQTRECQAVDSGREFEALCRAISGTKTTTAVRLMVTESGMEPGIVGIFRPVLLLPTGIADRLTDSQLDAIMVHELCHARRRDNLAAALHMLVEALFWFHPLVWWIGARLVDERERACDEEVLHLGSDPHVYAEGILKVCKFYLESPLVCAAGVTGSNLKQRIEEIMIRRIAHKLEMGKKLLLGMVAAAVIVGPVALGILHPARSQAQSQIQGPTAGSIQIESASIKPSETGNDESGGGNSRPIVSSRILYSPESFKATHVTLHELIREAFGVQNSQIAGGPDWVNTGFYDEEVKFTAAPGTDHPQRVVQLRLALQAVLADRFKLQVHRELKTLPVYELVVAPDGQKMTESRNTSDNSKKQVFSLLQGPPGHYTGTGVKMPVLIGVLEWQLGNPIIDKTGLKGAYDFTFTVEGEQTRPLPSDPAPLLKAISEQLGLELKPANDPVEVLVIDYAEPVTNSEKDLAQKH